MSTGLSIALITVSLLIAVWAVVVVIIDRRVTDWMIYALGGLELLVVAQLVLAIVDLARGQRPDSTVTFVAYAVAALLIAPVGLFWSVADKTRSSVLVITIACFALAVMTVRMLQMWSGVHG